MPIEATVEGGVQLLRSEARIRLVLYRVAGLVGILLPNAMQRQVGQTGGGREVKQVGEQKKRGHAL